MLKSTIEVEGYTLFEIEKDSPGLQDAINRLREQEGEPIVQWQDHLHYQTFRNHLNNESIEEAIYTEQPFSPIFPHKSYFPVKDPDTRYYQVEGHDLIVGVLEDLLPAAWDEEEGIF